MSVPVPAPRLRGGMATAVAGEPRLTDQEYAQLRDLVHRLSGIVLTPAKRVMVEVRLRRRLRANHLNSFNEYCHLLFQSAAGEREWQPLINAITVNKTDFFREPAHFDYLARRALPDLLRQGIGTERPLLVWSAACSTGEEPYTLSALLHSSNTGRNREIRYSIFATDICTDALQSATLAVYPEAAILPLPPQWRTKYFLRSKDKQRAAVRVAPEIRKRVEFAHLNLVSGPLDRIAAMDVIFCRNVIIYFDRTTQESVVRRLLTRLEPGGYLFMGHSEVLNGFDLPVAPIAPTVYRRLS